MEILSSNRDQTSDSGHGRQCPRSFGWWSHPSTSHAVNRCALGAWARFSLFSLVSIIYTHSRRTIDSAKSLKHDWVAAFFDRIARPAILLALDITEKNLLPPPIDESDEPFQSEADFLNFLTAACIQRGMTVDFTDDCASLSGTTDLISTDTIVERVHFETHTATPYQIGRQAAVVNLSDLAGSGGQPEWVLLSLQLPTGWFGTKLRELCAGFLDVDGASNITGWWKLLSCGRAALRGRNRGGPLLAPMPFCEAGIRR